jgi:hypothetical protein
MRTYLGSVHLLLETHHCPEAKIAVAFSSRTCANMLATIPP